MAEKNSRKGPRVGVEYVGKAAPLVENPPPTLKSQLHSDKAGQASVRAIHADVQPGLTSETAHVAGRPEILHS